MKQKVLVFSVIATCAMFVSSCSKNENEQTKSKQESFVVSKVDSITDLTSHLKAAYTQWNYPLLSNTNNSAKYFATGLYAVKITRSNGDASTLTFRLIIQNQSNPNRAYVWAYKNDTYNNQLYFSGVQTVTPGYSVSPIPNISITGNQSIIYVFKVVSPGYYMFWYTTWF